MCVGGAMLHTGSADQLRTNPTVSRHVTLLLLLKEAGHRLGGLAAVQELGDMVGLGQGV